MRYLVLYPKSRPKKKLYTFLNVIVRTIFNIDWYFPDESPFDVDFLLQVGCGKKKVRLSLY